MEAAGVILMNGEALPDSIWVNEGQYVILANAERLLYDAELLFKNERYASASSLAILALEEIGKIYLIGLGEIERQKNDRISPHRKKQEYANALLIAGPAITAISDFLKEENLPDGPVSAVAFLLAVVQCEKDAETDEDRAAFRELKERIEQEIKARLKDSEAARTSQSIYRGQANITKQAGFYCDVNADGKVLCDPLQISKEQANEWLERAQVVVCLCKELSSKKGRLSH